MAWLAKERTVKHAVVFGTNGGLARALAWAFDGAGWSVEPVARRESPSSSLADAYVFPQAVFLNEPFVSSDFDRIADVIDVGLTQVAARIHDCLRLDAPDKRLDYCLIGSTSSYAGFANTAAYCATKAGLVGLVRALNEEYKDTQRRFWLFSPGTMDTAMGRQLTDQDPTTFLSPHDVAERIVGTITAPGNMFEPEVVIRRRVVR